MKRILYISLLLMGCQSVEQPLDVPQVDESSEIKEVSAPVEETLEYKDWVDKMADCPFTTVRECLVWIQKQPIKQSKFLDTEFDIQTINGLNSNYISTSSGQMNELVSRYRLLMKTSRLCCNDNIISQSEHMDIDKDRLNTFLSDSNTFYNAGFRCLIVNPDAELQSSSKDDKNQDEDLEYNKQLAQMIKDAQSVCLCRNSETISEILKPFDNLYLDNPDFANKDFVITDKFTKSSYNINYDIKLLKQQLASCSN